MASFDEKTNGGFLSLEAQFGTKTFHPVKRLEPTPETTTQDPDQPTPTTDEPITRAYLVELRVGFQTRTKTTGQAPFLYCIYATPDCQRFFERRCPIDYNKQSFQIPEDTETYRSVATTKTGNPNLPSTPPGETHAETRRHYQRILKCCYDIDATTHTTPTEVRA
ncbi:hypothetical protein SAMN05421858_4297 [Haladaptatus litoreus]|uniref:Uncharacterized protein n=1 Tax=Haladaptatus litoreus TaxID=553468 RepID=A0A1N7EJ70_9EURY|nr:hypothetical protein [Haladaptatus litoreus]SIR88069.1 hypothetical protein SAMN05421858_4297 [Haladaptatus litoreus]